MIIKTKGTDMTDKKLMMAMGRERQEGDENNSVTMRNEECSGEVKGTARGKRYSIDDKELFKGEEFFFPPPEPS